MKSLSYMPRIKICLMIFSLESESGIQYVMFGYLMWNVYFVYVVETIVNKGKEPKSNTNVAPRRNSSCIRMITLVQESTYLPHNYMQAFGCKLYNTIKKGANFSFSLYYSFHFEKDTNNIDIWIHHIWTLEYNTHGLIWEFTKCNKTCPTQQQVTHSPANGEKIFTSIEVHQKYAEVMKQTSRTQLTHKFTTYPSLWYVDPRSVRSYESPTRKNSGEFDIIHLNYLLRCKTIELPRQSSLKVPRMSIHTLIFHTQSMHIKQCAFNPFGQLRFFPNCFVGTSYLSVNQMLQFCFWAPLPKTRPLA